MATIAPKHVRLLSHAEARTALDAALAKAEEIGVPSSVAVIDAGRDLVAFGRQDDAQLITAEVAINKAYTARSVNGPSSQLEEATKATGPFWGLQHGVSGRLVTFGGGFPIILDGFVVGAIGVGGGSVEQDVEVAQAGLAALGSAEAQQ
jgi:uncharacterized protein GlcG (DUF336 family)